MIQQLLLPKQVTIVSTEPSEHVEARVKGIDQGSVPKAIAPQPLTAAQELLQNISIGWRDLAGENAESIRRLSQATVEKALEIGQRLWRMQRDLKKRDYSTFLSILGWASAKARKFINLAKTFADFDPFHLINVELTTLLSLCSKRYLAVVDKLREVQDITQQLVEHLIKETRAPKKPKQEPISGWKQTRSGAGRYYNVLLHSEEAGLSIEQQAEAEAILPQRVIEEAVALRARHKSGWVQVSDYRLAQLEELPLVVDNARELDRQNRHLELELSKRDRRIAELEAELTKRVAVPFVESYGVQTDDAKVTSSELVASLEEEEQVSAIAPEQTTEIEPSMTQALSYSQPKQQSSHLELALEDDCLVEKQKSVQNLEPEHNLLQEGDLVQINGKVVLAKTEAGASRSTSPDSKLLTLSEQKPKSNRKLQPVEILTTAGEWIGGYFVHSCVAVANLVRTERQITLFDADGEMCRFFGQIRPPQAKFC